MPKFAANLSMMFTEVPFLDRFAAAREAGFKAAEFQFPYDFPAEEVATRARGLDIALFNLPPGDFAKGERGIACMPDRVAEFRDGVARAISYAKALQVSKLNCLAGIKPSDLPREKAIETLVENLNYASHELGQNGIALVIEPINPNDFPGFLLNSSRDGLDVIKATGSDIKLQYDLYHMQRVEGELINTLTRLLPMIGHIQLADAPMRHEPGTGEINFANVLRHIDELGYQGWIGCEYRPKAGTAAGLHWITDLGYAL